MKINYNLFTVSTLKVAAVVLCCQPLAFSADEIKPATLPPEVLPLKAFIDEFQGIKNIAIKYEITIEILQTIGGDDSAKNDKNSDDFAGVDPGKYTYKQDYWLDGEKFRSRTAAKGVAMSWDLAFDGTKYYQFDLDHGLMMIYGKVPDADVNQMPIPLFSPFEFGSSDDDKAEGKALRKKSDLIGGPFLQKVAKLKPRTLDQIPAKVVNMLGATDEHDFFEGGSGVLEGKEFSWILSYPKGKIAVPEAIARVSKKDNSLITATFIDYENVTVGGKIYHLPIKVETKCIGPHDKIIMDIVATCKERKINEGISADIFSIPLEKAGQVFDGESKKLIKK